MRHWKRHRARKEGAATQLTKPLGLETPIGSGPRLPASHIRLGAVVVWHSPSGIAKLLPRKSGVAAVGSGEWAPPFGGVRNLRAELTARCRRKPLAALVDEAHTLDLEVGRTLLNASQQVRADAPFLLILAGTPGLAAHLGAMNASFWSRLGEGRLGIGLLSDAAARAALNEPLAAHGEGIDADALATVVEESQRFANQFAPAPPKMLQKSGPFHAMATFSSR